MSAGRGHGRIGGSSAELVGEYRVVRPLGAGGMAEVFLVEKVEHVGARSIRKFFALKRIPRQYADDADRVHRFVSEMELAASLDHPNVVHVVDFGVHDGRYYLVLEYIKGHDLGTLSEKLAAHAAKHGAEYPGQERGALPISVVASIGLQAALGLAYLHGQRRREGDEFGLIHRDLSPDNLFLDIRGAVKIGDFGIAKVLRADGGIESGTGKYGKDRFASPEQAAQLAIDTRSDLYSLGLVLFYLLTGRLPYDDPRKPDENNVLRMARARRTERGPMAELVPHAPAPLQELLDRLLRGPRDERPASAQELIEPLKATIHALGLDLLEVQHLAGVLVHRFYERPDTIQEMDGYKGSGVWSAEPAPGEARLEQSAAPRTDDEEGVPEQSVLRVQPSVTRELASVPAPPSAELAPGTLLAERYRIVRLIGMGGMGAVYEAEHVDIRRRVALKVVHPQYASEADVIQRFRREAQAASTIGHPNIAEVTDFGRVADGRPFMVLELLQGRDWAADLKAQGPQPLAKVIQVLTQVCRALAAAHDKGIVHRDLKPENIFLVERAGDPYFTKIVDFGISKFQDTQSFGSDFVVTARGTALGTPNYMSPEQCRGSQSIDHRSDIYSLGVVLFRVLTAKYPIDGQTYADLVMNILTAAPLSLASLRPDLPHGLSDLVERMLAKQPEHRPASCAEIERALQDCLHAPIENPSDKTEPLDLVETVPVSPPSPEPDQRRPLVLALATASLVLLGLVVLAVVTFIDLGSDRRTPAEPTASSPVPSTSSSASPPVPMLEPAANLAPQTGALDTEALDAERDGAHPSEAADAEGAEAASNSATGSASTPASGAPALTVAAPCRVFVAIIPDGTILVDGASRGRAPRTVEVEPGEHTIAAVGPFGERRQRNLTCVDGERRRVAFDFL